MPTWGCLKLLVHCPLSNNSLTNLVFWGSGCVLSCGKKDAKGGSSPAMN